MRIICLATAIIAPVLLFLTTGASAQSDAQRLAVFQSERFADEANDALFQGDVATALVLALKGLPHQPDEAETATYRRAWFALHHAAAARFPRIDRLGHQSVTVSRDGTRMVIGSSGFGPGDQPELWPYALFDAVEGTFIKDLLPTDQTHNTYFTRPPSLPVSPDGKTFAILTNDGRVHLFDFKTGDVVRRFDALPTGGAGLPFLFVLGFSPDGSRFAASSFPTVGIWDVASGKLVSKVRAGDLKGARFWPAGWLQDGGIVGVYTTETGRGAQKKLTGVQVARLDDENLSPIVDLTQKPEWMAATDGSAYLKLSRETPYFTVTLVSYKNTIVFDTKGMLIGEFPSAMDTHLFVRNGTAVARLKDDTGLGMVDVFALDGAPLEANIQDSLPFLHGVSDMEGAQLGRAMVAFETDSFLAPDLPVGPALYDQVWSALPAETQAEISAARVARP